MSDDECRICGQRVEDHCDTACGGPGLTDYWRNKVAAVTRERDELRRAHAIQLAISQSLVDTMKKLEAERDALLVRIAELEAWK